jgi:16S rRNA processing protein RimM
VTDVLHHGQALLVVEGSGPRSGAEILVPFVAAIVPEVNMAGGRVVIDPPAGLIDPERSV